MLYPIEHLYMSCNPIGDTGASLIAEAIRETDTLKTLILSDCGFTSQDAENLSRALARHTCSSLKKLDIGWNSLEDELSTITQSLASNSVFVKLAIPGEFGSTTADCLSQEVNEARKRNGLPPIEIEGEYWMLCGYVIQVYSVCVIISGSSYLIILL